MVHFEQKFLVTVNLRPFVRGFAGVVWACLSWSAGPQARAAGNDLLRLPEGWRLASELMAGFPAHGLQLFVCDQASAPRPLRAYALAWDPTVPNISFKPVLQSAGRTPTQFYTEEPGRVYAAVNGGYNPQPFFNLYTQGENLNAALGQFSGELHSAERRVALQDTRVVRESALDRLSDGLTGGAATSSVTSENADKSTTIWMRAAGSWGTADADGSYSKFKADQTGLVMGAELASNGFKFGGMFNYTTTTVDFVSLGHSKVQSVGGAIYAGYRQDGSGFAVGLGGALAQNTADAKRAITLPGLSQTLSSKAKGMSEQLFGEASYDLTKAQDTRIEPFVRVAYAKLDSHALAETGGIAALSAGKQSNDLTIATLGLRGAYVTGKTTLSGSTGWQRTGGDRSAPTLVTMAGVNTAYEVRSAALDRDAIALQAQASFSLSTRMTLSAGYSGMIGKNNSDHGARVTISFAW